MLSKNKALVVFSGGQDSTTCLFWAKKHFEEVHAICFRYGQKHEQEVVYAQRIAERADVPFTVLDLSFIGWRLVGALTVGILNIVFTNPYQAAAETELYLTLRDKAE